jgi:hypothetical protein
MAWKSRERRLPFSSEGIAMNIGGLPCLPMRQGQM